MDTTREGDPLRVFISSRMRELVDLRASLRERLNRIEIDAFVYEADQGADPDDPERVSLRELERTDIVVLIVGDSYGAITEREYDRARELEKPCLVYERLGRPATEPELQRFIDKLSGPRGVPSRTTFRTAIDLADGVARDVQAWVVRQYRRLSAVQATMGESTRRRADLEAQLQRLLSTTRQSLARGTSGDLLAWQLQQWFEALGYPLDPAPDPSPHHSDLIVRIPERRKQFSRVLVRAKDGEIQLPDVELARAAAAEQSLDQVWLVALRRISPAARRAVEGVDGVFLYTLDELVEEDVDFENYFSWLDRQVQDAAIDQRYVALAVTVTEVDGSGNSRAESMHDDVAQYVDRWLEDGDGEHLSLLGEFGTGKSWFALKYAHDMVSRYREARAKGGPRPRVPLVIRLREYARGFKDVGALLTEFVFREHQMNIRSFAVLEALNRMGRLLFIFDGFDEMAARVDQEKMIDNFWSLAVVLGPGSKAILTCRSEYFQFATQARELLAGKLRAHAQELLEPTRFQVAFLQMLDEPRLRKVLSLRSADQKLIDAVLSNQKLTDLGRRPVMVDLLIEAMPDLETESADLAHVYYKAVFRKMDRDISLGRTFTSMSDKFFFMCELSWRMLSTHQLKIHYKEIPERIREYFGHAIGSAEEDYWRNDLLAQTMLVRDDDGNYRPAHKSLIEFFASYKLAAEIGSLKTDYLGAAQAHSDVDGKRKAIPQPWSGFFRKTGTGARTLVPLSRFAREAAGQLTVTWGKLSLDNATTELLFALCDRDEMLAGVRALAAPKDASGEVAARILAVAAFDGKLCGVDLEGARLDGCRLSGCDLSGANLSASVWSGGSLNLVKLDRASLRGARLSKIAMVGVTFQGTDLAGCQFGPDAAVACVVVGGAWCVTASGECLVAVLADGRTAAIAVGEDGTLRASRVHLDREASGRSPSEVASWLAGLQGEQALAELDIAVLSCDGWTSGTNWTERTLRDDVVGSFDIGWTGPGGDVERLNISVTRRSSGETLLRLTLHDPTDLAVGPYLVQRALGVSRHGNMVAVVSEDAQQNVEARIDRGTNAGSSRLDGFRGTMQSSRSDTIDKRGAAFSPSNAVLTVCEAPDTIAFWHTANGRLLGRIQFLTLTQGCVVDEASVLPKGLVPLAADDGRWWRQEPPL